jgi:hypothetical protein
VFENDGAGSFSPGPLLTASAASEDDDDAFVADVNGDGRPDLILGGPSAVSVFLDEPVAAKSPQSQPGATHRRAASLLASLKLSRRAHDGKRSLRVDGRLRLQAGLTASAQVCTGSVLVAVKLHGRTLARRTAKLTSACAFSDTLAIGARELRGRSRPTASLSFDGNAYLLAASSRRRI